MLHFDDKQDVIDALHDGILKQRVVGYVYRDSRGRTQRGHLAAYAMLLYRQGLYVVGSRLASTNADREPAAWRKRLGVFAVERFTDAEALRERFDVPADFRLDQVLHGAFGIHVQSDNEPRRVVIEFSKEKAMLVRARVWHPSQQLEDLPDGGVRFSFSCSNLTPVVSWILEWGPHARVLSPDELRTQVVNELDRARALYA